MNYVRLESALMWSLDDEDGLFPYPANQLEIDTAHTFAHLDDVGGIVPISHGLKARDVIVSLHLFGSREGKKQPIRVTKGFVVTDVNVADGSGVIVHHDLLDTEEKIQQVMHDALFSKLTYVESGEEGSVSALQEFGLHSLAAYIRNRKQP